MTETQENKNSLGRFSVGEDILADQVSLLEQNKSGSGFKLAVVSAIDITLKILVIAQIKAAQKQGFEVYGICSEGPNFDMLRDQGIKMHPIRIKRSISPLSDLKSLWQMYRYFKKEKIDIVHAHTPKVVLLAPIAAKLARVPIRICTLRGFTVREGLKPLAKFVCRIMAWITSKCSTFQLSQNPEDVKRYVSLRVCKENRIAPLGNGVDLQKFDPDRFNTEFMKQKRAEIGIPVDAVVIGIIARLVRKKGYLELFAAFKRIIIEKDNVWLIIIGPEESEKADRISTDTFKDYGIQNRTKYLKARDDIPELLGCCDIFTLPSWREGFPRSPIEAAAMRLPIVATDIQGCRQVVENDKNGILVPLRNAEQLEIALLRLIENPDLRKQMGRVGYEKAQKEFDETRVCQNVTHTYKTLLGDYNGICTSTT